MEPYPAWVSTVVKDAQALVQTAAVVAGGMWAYMKFVKGRMFYPRLETSVSGAAAHRGGQTVLTAALEIKNVGLSRVDIRQKGSGLRILAANEIEATGIVAPDWTHLGTFSVFENHGWVEPGETINENRILVIPGGAERDYLLELHIGSGAMVWIATSLVISGSPANIKPDTTEMVW